MRSVPGVFSFCQLLFQLHVFSYLIIFESVKYVTNSMYHQALHQRKYNLQHYKKYTARPETLRQAIYCLSIFEKTSCTGNLLPAHKIFIERPA